MVKIRLARHGRTHLPVYWIVAAHSAAPRDGKFLEKLGTYHPKNADNKICIKSIERMVAWIKNGAQLTDRVKRIMHHMTEKDPNVAQHFSTLNKDILSGYMRKERAPKAK